MNKTCTICEGEGKYKCPTCLIFYCSVICCKKHRANRCDVVKKEEEKQEQDEDEDAARPEKKRKIQLEDEDVIPEEKLAFLKNNEEVKRLLTNSHLRDLLVHINDSEDVEDVMAKAMQEPIFVEFADACLKVVEPPSEDNM